MKNYFTIMLVPHSPNSRTVTVRIPRWTVHAALFIILSSAVVFVSSVVYSSHVTRRMVSYEEMKAQTSLQKQEVERYSQETQKLSRMMAEITDKENQIRKMLGLKDVRLTAGLTGKSEYSLGQKLSSLRDGVKESRIRLDSLMNRVTEMRKRFAFTPSIWPAHGRIMSTFGYRSFPWRGFHAGLDINTAYGTPIKAAAGGAVSYAGWRSGYGNTVVIDHGSGFETLYGHISRIKILSGQKVKKGDIIAFVGTSGYATGPHLHYEVSVNGSKVDPARYLDLNMLQASSRR